MHCCFAQTLGLQYKEAMNFLSSWDASGRNQSMSMLVMPKMHGVHLQHSISKGDNIKQFLIACKGMS